MIDFSKLKTRSPKERATDEERRNANAIAEDRKWRLERSKKTVTITITDETDARFTTTGNRIVNFHGVDGRRRNVRVTWFAPKDAERDLVDQIIDHLTAGADVTLKGYWKPHITSRGETAFTFIAQFIEPIFPQYSTEPTDLVAHLSAFGTD